jgi:hypothetical protein
MTHARAFGFILLSITAGAWAQREPLPLANFTGILKSLDDKSIVLSLDDRRAMEFKRTSKTRFFSGGKELKTPDFKPGDAVTIDGQQDPLGYLTAINVRLDKPSAAAASPGKVYDAWADANSPGKADDDPGPPQLRRKGVADPSRERSTPVPEDPNAVAEAPDVGGTIARQSPAPATPPSPSRLPEPRSATTPAAPDSPPAAATIRPDEDLPFGAASGEDSLIRRAADAALDFAATLPNYICREVISRSQSTTRNVAWRLIDTVEADLVLENGKEDYRNISLNGKPVNKKLDELGGAWSTGEFATVLRNLFSPTTMAEFHFLKSSRIAGMDAREYSFSVKQERSMWDVHVGSDSYRPAYTGRVWIDPSNARTLRIEMESVDLPKTFGFDRVETSTDYEYVRLSGGATQYLLPVRAAILSCQRGTFNCVRNNMDFRNYRKFGAESNIQYGDAPQKMF